MLGSSVLLGLLAVLGTMGKKTNPELEIQNLRTCARAQH